LAVGGMSTCRETACAGRSQRSFISLTRLDREPARGLGEAQASLTLRTGLRRGAAGMVAESLAFGVTRDSRLHGACLGGATQGLWVPGGGAVCVGAWFLEPMRRGGCRMVQRAESGLAGSTDTVRGGMTLRRRPGLEPLAAERVLNYEGLGAIVWEPR